MNQGHHDQAMYQVTVIPLVSQTLSKAHVINCYHKTVTRAKIETKVSSTFQLIMAIF